MCVLCVCVWMDGQMILTIDLEFVSYSKKRQELFTQDRCVLLDLG